MNEFVGVCLSLYVCRHVFVCVCVCMCVCVCLSVFLFCWLMRRILNGSVLSRNAEPTSHFTMPKVFLATLNMLTTSASIATFAFTAMAAPLRPVMSCGGEI